MGKQQSGWFKVWSDILDDPKIHAVGLEGLGAFVGLLAVLNRQGSESGFALVSEQSLRAICMCETTKKAERIVGRLVAEGLCTMRRIVVDDPSTNRRRRVDYSFEVSKWLERQELNFPTKTKTKTNTKTIPPNPPPDSSKPGNTPDCVAPPDGTAAPRRGRKRRPEIQFPDPFPDDERQRLYRLAAEHDLTPAQCDYAIEAKRRRAVANGTTKKDWVLAVLNGMLPDMDRHLLKGFEEVDNARRREQVEALEARHAAKAPPVAQEIPEGLKGLLG